MKKEKVVLAFSGGLDTSFCVKYLSEEKGYEVHTAIANTGGFSPAELKVIEQKALALGAASHVTLDIEQEYYEKSIKYMVFGNILRNGTYPISVSSERIFQAIAIIEYAKRIGADAVAHGSTGAGNDQVRFDLTFQILAPEIEIITPTRDMTLTREYEIEYLRRHGFTADFKKMEYSINKGLWGTSIGGKETLHSEQTLPEEAYPSQIEAEGEERLTIAFDRGEIAAVNGIHYQTGEKIPQEYITKIHEAANFQSGYQNDRQLSFGLVDMAWHSVTSPVNGSIQAFENQAMAPTESFPPVDSSCFSTGFGHIFGGGYAAGYYSYKWAEVLDADAFSVFKQQGIYDQATAESFRKNILEKGGSEHPMILYKRFRGQEPTIDALLERSGLKSKSE